MSFLDGELTTIALCWRIERRDGVTIGLTAHDRDLEIDGLVYRAAPGMTPSAIQRSASLDAGSMDVTGALTGEAISETDLLAGRWDGARVVPFATDWSAPGERVALGEGTIGAVETAGGMLTAELRGIAAGLERPVVEATSPDCRAALGDKRCRVPMARRRRFARVVSVEGEALVIDRAEPEANAYGGGLLRWFGGPNSGLEDAIARSEGSGLVLRRPPRFEAAGALVELIEGCDKRLATCAGRFGNAVNFRGEPYLPGIDLLTRYPGA
ncbi:MAG: DUF2163 domain-containing protein [Sphingomonas sp.]|uniref:DUF2163 domain-containing protein n=1 Tax=Sphingomonas sp. TaxID=28214 RepID=UPI001B02C9D2|nr:DUF2163 domain-containing protein [Sphingomonas sp.]MBO9622138.1 DUF2163 domain-containing protein [Sphingomonas sp.]